MKKNSYRFEKNFLIVRTECGEYRFKIDNDTELANAQPIADLMVHEIDRVEEMDRTGRQTNPYAKLLLSNLNIASKYIRLEKKYDRLIQKYEAIKEINETKKSSAAESYNKPDDKPDDKTDKKDDTIAEEKFDSISEKLPVQKEMLLKKKIADDLRRIAASLPLVKPQSRQEPLPPAPRTESTQPPEPETTPEPESTFDPESASNAELEIKPQLDDTEPESKIEPESTSIAPVTLPKSPPEPEHEHEPDLELAIEFQSESELEIEPAITPEIVQESKSETQSDPEPKPNIEPVSQATHEHGPEPAPKPDLVNQLSEPSSQFKINRPETISSRFIEPENQKSDQFQLPSLDFLKSSEVAIEVDHEAIRRDAELLEQKLGYFGIKGEVMAVSPGPVITTFEYKPAPGIKISKIVNLADDLALALSALSIRIVAPIPGKDVIGVEIPNAKMSIVPFIDIVGSEDFMNIESATPICLGKDIIGNPVVVGLEHMPHLLIAGATGTGKSVGLNAMIASILYKSPPDRVKFIMIDPKRIELSLFNDIPHLLTPVITDMKKANTALQWVVRQMEERYEMLAKLQVRNIEQYNQKIKTADLSGYDDEDFFEEFPYIVIIIDELADLMMTASKDIEFSLTRIAQMARAAGIHLILATQRPSVDVLTGIIKANFPTRISFQVSSKTDSRTIIDANGAETLLGRGDMLFVPPGTARLSRVHGTYLSEEELITITNFLKSQGKPRYVLDVTTEREEEPMVDMGGDDDYDEKYQAALEYVLATRQASISSVQRALRVGYNRAARIIDLMEKKGIVGQSDGVKPRQVLVDHME